MNREKWLKWRRGGICGSDIAAVIDRAQAGRRTAIDIYNEKLEIVPSSAPSEAMKWGLILEKPVADEYARQFAVRYSTDHQLTIQGDGKKSWMRGTPDRIVVKPERYGLDIKLSSTGYGYGKNSDDDVPNETLLQCLWYMHITKTARLHGGIDQWKVFLLAGLQSSVYTINYSKELAVKIEERCRAFWFENILKQNPPGQNTDESISDYIRKRYIEVSGTHKASPVLVKLVDDYERAREKAKELHEQHVAHYEQKAEEMKEKIMQLAAGKAIVLTPHYKLRWTNGGKVDWEALALSLGAKKKQIEKFTDKTKGKSLRITPLKGE